MDSFVFDKKVTIILNCYLVNSKLNWTLYRKKGLISKETVVRSRCVSETQNFGLSNKLIRSNYHRRKITKLRFRALALRQRANVRKVSFVNKPSYSGNLTHIKYFDIFCILMNLLTIK